MERSAALVGFGRWGKNIARNLFELGVLHTICDEQIFAQLPFPHVNVTTDYQSLISDSKIKQIFIATPPHTHYALAKQALLAGKDVFVEKPLCIDLEEGRELIELAENKNLILMVGHILHYHPCVQKIKELIFSGVIGDIRYISSNRLFPGYIRDENVIWDLLPHDISIILSLCQATIPTTVHSQGSVNEFYNRLDTVIATMQFENNIAVHVHASWVYPFKEQKLTIIGTKGSIVFDDTKATEKLTVHSLSYSSSRKVEYELVKIELPEGEPLKRECEHFLSCCLRRQRPHTDGLDGISVLQILNRLQESLIVVEHRLNI